MKLIDAVWEKRNLGVTTAEIIIEASDTIKDIENSLKYIDKQYVVCKVISGFNEATSIVQELGYKYIEDQIEIEHDLHEIKRNRIMQRLYDSLDYSIMADKDLIELYQEIDRGMFDSDRISLDPYFSRDKAKLRYINWIKDLVSKGAKPYIMRYNGKSAGFIILTTEDGVTYKSVLGGGYERFRKTGLGIVQKEQEIVKSLGGKKVVTSVSSNNVGQFKALIVNGYVPVKIEQVFVKHN